MDSHRQSIAGSDPFWQSKIALDIELCFVMMGLVERGYR